MLTFHPYHWNQLSHSPGQQAPYKKGLSWTLAALPSSAADVMSQSFAQQRQQPNVAVALLLTL